MGGKWRHVAFLTNQQAPDPNERTIALDPSLGEAQLRFRLAQRPIALECNHVLEGLVDAAVAPDPLSATQLKSPNRLYGRCMFMPYEPFLQAAQDHRYDLDWLSRHFACTFEQVCHRILALRKPGHSGCPLPFKGIACGADNNARVVAWAGVA